MSRILISIIAAFSFCITAFAQENNVAKLNSKITWFPIIKDGKVGYIDNKGVLQVNAELPRKSSYELPIVTTDLFEIKNDDNVVIFNRATNSLWMEKAFDKVYVDTASKLIQIGMVPEEDKNGFGIGNELYGFYDYAGNEVIPVKFKKPLMGSYGFNDGVTLIENDDNQTGAIDKKGKIVIPCIYNYMSSFSNGLCAANKEKDGNYGYVDNKGKEVIPFTLYSANEFADNGLAIVTTSKGKGISIINKQGKFIKKDLPYATKGFFLSGAKYQSNRLKVYDSVSKKYGFLDEKGNLVIKLKYDRVGDFNDEGFAIVNTGGKMSDAKYFADIEGGAWNIIDFSGKELIKNIEAQEIYYIGDNIFGIKKNGKWGLVNKSGVIIMTPKFEYCPGQFIEGISRVTEKSLEKHGFLSYDKIGYINSKGEYVWKISE